MYRFCTCNEIEIIWSYEKMVQPTVVNEAQRELQTHHSFFFKKECFLLLLYLSGPVLNVFFSLDKH